MDYAIGIDLGTCNCAVTHLNSAGKSEIITNYAGKRLTPSVINFAKDGKQYYGEAALRVMYDEDEITCARFKRHMGTEKTWSISGAKYDATELSAMLLEKLATDTLAELQRGDPDAVIVGAVVTVPAEFSNRARDATREAAEAAGVKVLGLLDEPTAAVLYHQHCLGGKSDANGIYAVVDLGGGTLDISIVHVEGQNFSVRCSTGSVEIGGVDFDAKLWQVMGNKLAKFDGCILDDDPLKAVAVKEDLSIKETRVVRLNGTNPQTGELDRRSFDISRADFEDSIHDLVDLMGDKCLEAMEKASVTPEQLRHVLLVGGSTRVPAIERKIDDIFEMKSLRIKDCDEAVARGAGLHAASKSVAEIPYNDHQRKAIGKIELTEILHKFYGVISLDASDNEMIDFVLDRGTPVPCRSEKEFHLRRKDTLSSDYRTVEWSITESDNRDTDPLSESSRIIQVETLIIPTSTRRPSDSSDDRRRLSATFRCDENKVLHCEFLDMATGAKSVTKPIALREIRERS